MPECSSEHCATSHCSRKEKCVYAHFFHNFCASHLVVQTVQGELGGMNPVKILSSLALLLAVFLSGCASTPESRIEKHPEAFAALPAQDQALVRGGHIREGMDRMGVYLAWGRAPEIFMGERNGKRTEVWQYFRTRSTFVDMAPVPYPYYPYGFYEGGTAIITEEIPGKHAAFVNGRVVEWGAPMRRSY